MYSYISVVELGREYSYVLLHIVGSVRENNDLRALADYIAILSSQSKFDLDKIATESSFSRN